MAFLWKAIGLSGSVPGFPYSPRSGAAGTTTTSTVPTLTWTMRPGVGDADERPVTIFSVNLASADGSVKELARHAMRRAKSLLLPGLLRCYGAVEHQETLYIATDPCEPLSAALRPGSGDDGDDEDTFHESVALGLKSIGTALAAMHKNSIVHGNVSCDAVFVLTSGEWRLFGLELASAYGEVDGIYHRYAALLPDYRRPPETTQGVNGSSEHVRKMDSWGVACLIYEVLGVPAGQPRGQLIAGCKEGDLRKCRNLPRTLQSGFMGLCASNPKMRHDVERFLESSEFIVGSEFVQSMQMLEELSIKDPVERDRFFEHLSTVIDSFPLRICKCMALKKLKDFLKFGVSVSVVDPVLKIAARIVVPEEYGAHVAPVIVDLFASPDRMVRYRLLQRVQEYAPSLPPTVVNTQIWPLLITGFTNPSPSIREYTVRAIASFCPLLSEKIVVNSVTKYIAQMQQDPEGAIRTNATITLCLIADSFPAAQRSKILVHGFGRMLKDPFPPSRQSALRSFETTFRHLSVQDVAELMLPGIAPLTLDSVADVRRLALSLVRAAADRIEAHGAEEAAKGPDAAAATAAAAATGEGSGDPRGGKEVSAGWGWRWGFGAASEAPKSATPPVEITAASSGPNQAEQREQEQKQKPEPHRVSPVDDFNDDDEDAWGTDIQLSAKVTPPCATVSKKKVDDASSFSHSNSESLPGDNATTGMAPMRLRKKGLGAKRVL